MLVEATWKAILIGGSKVDDELVCVRAKYHQKGIHDETPTLPWPAVFAGNSRYYSQCPDHDLLIIARHLIFRFRFAVCKCFSQHSLGLRNLAPAIWRSASNLRDAFLTPAASRSASDYYISIFMFLLCFSLFFAHAITSFFYFLSTGQSSGYVRKVVAYLGLFVQVGEQQSRRVSCKVAS